MRSRDRPSRRRSSARAARALRRPPTAPIRSAARDNRAVRGRASSAHSRARRRGHEAPSDCCRSSSSPPRSPSAANPSPAAVTKNSGVAGAGRSVKTAADCGVAVAGSHEYNVPREQRLSEAALLLLRRLRPHHPGTSEGRGGGTRLVLRVTARHDEVARQCVLRVVQRQQTGLAGEDLCGSGPSKTSVPPGSIRCTARRSRRCG